MARRRASAAGIRRVGAIVAALVGVSLGSCLGDGTAWAHGPVGIFQFQPSTPAGPLTVTFRVRLIYANDTEPVTSGATVTVEGIGPSGARVGPVPLSYTGTDGYYQTSVVFPAPGSWAMTFRSTTPSATYQHTETVAGPTTTTPPTGPTVTAGPSPTPPPTTPATLGGNPPTTPTTRTSSSTTTTTELPSTDATTEPTTSTVPDSTTTEASTPASTGTAPTTAVQESAAAQVQIESGPGPGMNWAAVGLGAVAAASTAGVAVTIMVRRP